MSKMLNAVRGKPTGLYLRVLPPGQTEFTPITLTVAAAGAAVGANAIPLDAALTELVPAKTVLIWERDAGDPDFLKIVTTTDAAIGATSLEIEMFDGIKGQGLTHALAEGDAAEWDLLYTDASASDQDYSHNPQTQDLQAIVFGGDGDISVTQTEITSISPQIARQGFFDPDAILTRQIIDYADTNALWYCKQVKPRQNGQPYLIREGLAKVTNNSEPTPAAGQLAMSYTIVFQEKPKREFVEIGESSGS